MNVREITSDDVDLLYGLAPDDEELDGNEGFIDISGANAMLWRDGVHPLTELRERQFFRFLGPPTASWINLLRAALAVLPDDISQVRVEVSQSDHAGALGDALRASGFVDQILRIRKKIAATAERALPDDTVIRRLAPAEEGFAVHCVSRAITQALDTPVPVSRVEQFASDWMKEGWSSQALRSYVVVSGGVLVAHALVSLEGAGGELVDVVVPDDDQRSKGWSRELSAFVEADLAREGVSTLDGTVVTPDGVHPNGLLANLAQSGWWIDSVSMIRKSV